MAANAYRGLSRLGAGLPLTVLVVVTLVASVNRQLVSLISQSVKVDLSLSDSQIGLAWSAVGFFVAICAPLLGQWVDRRDRYRILFVCILVWSAATASYGLATSYLMLVIGLAVLATSESSLAPVSNSLIGDQFRDEKRVNANLIYFAAGGLTTGVGTFVAGSLLHWSDSAFWQSMTSGIAHAPWRLSMLIVAAAGIPLALLVTTLGKDDRRAVAAPMTDWSDIAAYWREHWKTLLSFNLSNAGYYIAATSIMGWMPMYIIRHYGISPAELGTRMGVVIGVADVLGILVGFFAIKKLYGRLGPIAPRYIFQISLILIALLSIGFLGVRTAWGALILLGCQNFLATLGTASFNNMVQDMSAPEIRGKVCGINAVIVSLASIPGPLAVGILSDMLGGNGSGLLLAILCVSIPTLLFSAVLYGATNTSFLATVGAMRERECEQALAAA